MMQIQLDLYGACRDLHSQPSLSITLPQGSLVGALRAALPASFDRADLARATALVASSAFASDSALLRDADVIPADGRLAILPPVSGG
jgi:molybdopterin synthase sulfur carrier subunit